ncbi:MAG: IclR family transcriptional regulator [Dehalococcoidales bacterium]|nr:IclR family transcriptional regulator [Dehalococcoidales bacterium]
MEALRRAVSILDCLAHAAEPELGVDQLSQATGLSRSTTHRFLSSLKELGLVQQNPATTRYRLGYKVAELATRLGGHWNLREMALPYMARLRDLSGETIGLCIPADAAARLYVEEMEGIHEVRVRLPKGKLLPLHIGAPGRLLAAWRSAAEIEQVIGLAPSAEASRGGPFDAVRFREELAQIREKGYAAATAEYIAGTATIAVPIRDGSGRVVASLGATGPRIRFTAAQQQSILPSLLAAAAELSASLGYRPDLPAAALTLSLVAGQDVGGDTGQN